MGFWFWLKALAPVVVVHNRSFFFGELRMFTIKNIPNGKKFSVDYEAAERELKILPEPDRKQCEEVIANLKDERLKIGNNLAYEYSVFIKMGCGHWEHLQVCDYELGYDLKQPNCTACICGWNKKRA